MSRTIWYVVFDYVDKVCFELQVNKRLYLIYTNYEGLNFNYGNPAVTFDTAHPTYLLHEAESFLRS